MEIECHRADLCNSYEHDRGRGQYNTGCLGMCPKHLCQNFVQFFMVSRVSYHRHLSGLSHTHHTLLYVVGTVDEVGFSSGATNGSDFGKRLGHESSGRAFRLTTKR